MIRQICIWILNIFIKEILFSSITTFDHNANFLSILILAVKFSSTFEIYLFLKCKLLLNFYYLPKKFFDFQIISIPWGTFSQAWGHCRLRLACSNINISRTLQCPKRFEGKERKYSEKYSQQNIGLVAANVVNPDWYTSLCWQDSKLIRSSRGGGRIRMVGWLGGRGGSLVSPFLWVCANRIGEDISSDQKCIVNTFFIYILILDIIPFFLLCTISYIQSLWHLDTHQDHNWQFFDGLL